MARYTIQVGKCSGAYKTRSSSDNATQIEMHYRGINVGRGYKKRLLDNGKVVARTQPDADYCRRR